MKKIIAAVAVALAAACSTAPLSGPDVAPICKTGCYEN